MKQESLHYLRDCFKITFRNRAGKIYNVNEIVALIAVVCTVDKKDKTVLSFGCSLGEEALLVYFSSINEWPDIIVLNQSLVDFPMLYNGVKVYYKRDRRVTRHIPDPHT